MNILAFDTSGAACSAAVLSDGAVAAHQGMVMERGHGERLLPMIRDVLAESGLVWGDLGLIAVTTGPGAFTGIRIGLAAARGLALASGVPLRGVTAFAAVAASLQGEEAGVPLAVILESRRESLFVQVFGGEGATAPASVGVEDLAAFLPPGPIRLAGDAAERADAALRRAGRMDGIVVTTLPPDARDVARIAGGTPELGPEPGGPHPLYLRQPDVSLPAGR